MMTSEAVAVNFENRREGGMSDRPPGPRGTAAARTLARIVTGQ
jgi:hypothetical protein